MTKNEIRSMIPIEANNLNQKLIAISVSEETYDLVQQIVAGEGDVAIQKLIGDTLTDIANGAVMLDIGSLKRMREVTGLPMSDPGEVVRQVEKSVNLEGNRVVFHWTVDPTLEVGMRDAARRYNITTQQLAQRIIDHVLYRGNLFSVNPEPHEVVRFKPEQMAKLRELLGKDHVLAEDILEVAQAEAVPEFMKV